MQPHMYEAKLRWLNFLRLRADDSFSCAQALRQELSLELKNPSGSKEIRAFLLTHAVAS